VKVAEHDNTLDAKTGVLAPPLPALRTQSVTSNAMQQLFAAFKTEVHHPSI
jgi:hypothetical protein